MNEKTGVFQYFGNSPNKANWADFKVFVNMIGDRMHRLAAGLAWLGVLIAAVAQATPANKAAFAKYYGQYLPTNLNSCTTCHLPAKLDHPPEDLDEFPHNEFGKRLRALGKELSAAGKPKDIASRLALIAREDADKDGVLNEAELLLGHNPGEANDKPTRQELGGLAERQKNFAVLLKKYRWEPFLPVKQPAVPLPLAEVTRNLPGKGGVVLASRANGRSPVTWGRNTIDAFIAAEHAERGLQPRPEASKGVLLRRVYLDLIGLTPTLEEQRRFEADQSTDAYEKVVDRLLDDPRYGERWARHWMDIWRYSDWAGWTDGNQVRDSKPHIWRWRDWIIEALNSDKGYDRMLMEMLAGDELAPEDTNTLRATGFLVRNYKMLSREQWLEDTVKHTSQAFLGLTVGCAKCHNHMFDPISQKEYYQIRAVFEPHQVRTDRLPGEFDTAKVGLVRVFDTATNAVTYLFPRGDERRPDTNQIMAPGVPALLGLGLASAQANRLEITPVKLPEYAAHPDRKSFVIEATIDAAEREASAVRKKSDSARAALAKATSGTNAIAAERSLAEAEATVAVAEARLEAIRAVLGAEGLEGSGKKQSNDWSEAARRAFSMQRKQALAEAKQKLLLARNAESDAAAKVNLMPEKPKEAEKTAKELETSKKKRQEAEKAFATAEESFKKEPSTAFTPRSTDDYPETSTGRRLAFARWLTRTENPLTARVAVNHVWLRHFGQGIVATPNDFGANGKPASHPALLDWLAAEFMGHHWSMKELHRLILTSSTYRMSSTPDEKNLQIDPDNIYLWRMPSKRMEAELVRDNLLYLGGNLDLTMGGPEIDQKLGLTSKRRSVYLRTAAEKEVEFLKLFDNASVTECYMRKPSVMPQQALALANSELALNQASLIAENLERSTSSDPAAFIDLAYRTILARAPKRDEAELCGRFLATPSKQTGAQAAVGLVRVSAGRKPASADAATRTRTRDLVLVLMNHNDFVSIR